MRASATCACSARAAQAFHIANCAVSLAHAGRYESVSVALGARISRYDLNVAADGRRRGMLDRRPGADRRHASSRTRTRCIDHGTAARREPAVAQDASSTAPRTRCSTARSWCARARSSPIRRSRAATCCLSAKARVDTKPQLEIFADDVKCAHGATVGQLDAEEVFYLRSRGLSDAAARNLLTYAFGAEIIDRIPVPRSNIRSSRRCSHRPAAI